MAFETLTPSQLQASAENPRKTFNDETIRGLVQCIKTDELDLGERFIAQTGTFVGSFMAVAAFLGLPIIQEIMSWTIGFFILAVFFSVVCNL